MKKKVWQEKLFWLLAALAAVGAAEIANVASYFLAKQGNTVAIIGGSAYSILFVAFRAERSHNQRMDPAAFFVANRLADGTLYSQAFPNDDRCCGCGHGFEHDLRIALLYRYLEDADAGERLHKLGSGL